MNDAEAQRQVAQMVEFIKQEANEKADEIRVKTDQEFNIAKLAHLEQAKMDIKKEFEKKRTDLQTQSRIKRSGKVNEARMNAMQKQNDVVETVKSMAADRLAKAKDSIGYQDLVRALVVQGLIKLREEKVVVRCREEDKTIVEGVLSQAAEEYSSIMKRDVGIDVKTELTVDDQWLAPGPGNGQDENAFSCLGGVELLAHNSRIVVSNTLDSRLDQCFEELKPTVREMMFGGNVRAASGLANRIASARSNVTSILPDTNTPPESGAPSKQSSFQSSKQSSFKSKRSSKKSKRGRK